MSVSDDLRRCYRVGHGAKFVQTDETGMGSSQDQLSSALGTDFILSCTFPNEFGGRVEHSYSPAGGIRRSRENLRERVYIKNDYLECTIVGLGAIVVV